ncbi:MAG: hypothetical protein KKH04_19835 [Proteobacteria bacterium]|nr:hypothetical protein [Pseudomonadota bacterium]
MGYDDLQQDEAHHHDWLIKKIEDRISKLMTGDVEPSIPIPPKKSLETSHIVSPPEKTRTILAESNIVANVDCVCRKNSSNPCNAPFGPGLLLSAPTGEIIQIIFTSVVGVTAFAIGLQGFAVVQCTWTERFLALAAGILLIEPGFITDAVGAFIIAIFVFSHHLRWRRSKKRNSAGRRDEKMTSGPDNLFWGKPYD